MKYIFLLTINSLRINISRYNEKMDAVVLQLPCDKNIIVDERGSDEDKAPDFD